MSEEPTGYERRIAELERRVADLEAQVAPAERAAGPARAAASLQRALATRLPADARPDSGSRARSGWWHGEAWFKMGEGWLGRAGVGLVVFGLIFLYRYAVDRGWLTPELRIAAGLLIGGGLLGAGLRFFADRLRYRQILMGGGVIILFITGLAASELYQLVSGSVSLLFQGLVAVGAFTIAVRQRDSVMASIGAVGGLVPPAFLLQDAVAGPVLWLYLLLVSVWAGLLVARHAPGRFALLATASAVTAMFRTVPAESATRTTAIAAVAGTWLMYAALPLLRGTLPWATPYPQPSERAAGFRLLQPVVVSVLLATAMATMVWRHPHTLEWSVAAAAAGFALLAAFLWSSRAAAGNASIDGRIVDVMMGTDDFGAAAAALAMSLAVLALAALEPAMRFPAVAAIATACYLAAPVLRAPVLAPLAHALYATVALAFADRIESLSNGPAFDPTAIGFAATSALAAVIALSGRTVLERRGYAAAVYVLAHVLLATELGAVPGAPWLASASFALVGSGLVLVGLSRGELRLQRAGLLSLALLVLRLFAYDLAHAGVGVRIVLFLASGFAFLALSYLFRGRRAAG